MKSRIRFFLLIVIFSFIFPIKVQAKEGTLFLYLNIKPNSKNLSISFAIKSIIIYSEKGDSYELNLLETTINSSSTIQSQFLLAQEKLPFDNYNELKMIIENPTMLSKTGSIRLNYNSTIKIKIDLKLSKDKSCRTVFLDWYPDLSVKNIEFNPLILPSYEKNIVYTSALFVANEESNCISVIDKNHDEIIRNICVGEKPVSLILNQSQVRPYMYAVNSESNTLSLINLSQYEQENEFQLKSGSKPIAIVSVGSLTGNEYILIANYLSGTVSFLDSKTFQIIDEIPLRNNPIQIVVDPPLNKIQKSRYLSFKEITDWLNYRGRYLNIYILSTTSMSVIVFDMYTSRIYKLFDINLISTPSSIDIDPNRGFLYISFNKMNTLFAYKVFDIVYGKLPTYHELTTIPFAPNYIKYDNELDYVYLIYDNQISVIKPQLPSYSLINQATIGGKMVYILIDRENNKLYLIDKEKNSLYVLERGTLYLKKIVPTALKPVYGVIAEYDS